MDRFPGRRGRVKYDDFLEAVKPSRSRSRPRGALPLRGLSASLRSAGARTTGPSGISTRTGRAASSGASSGAGSKLGFEFDGGEFDRVVERLDRGGDGTVSLREFLKFAEAPGRGPDSDDAVDEVMGRLRGARLRGGGAVSRRADRAFATLGFELSSSDARRVADRFDRGGAVAWRDLARYADGDGDGDGATAALQAAGPRPRRVGDGLSPDDIFAHFDLDGDGTIDEREFAKAMKKLGVSLSSREVRKTMAQFPARGRLKYRDFLKAILPSAQSTARADSAAAPERRRALKRVASAAVAFSALGAPLVALPEAALAAKPSDAATSAGRVNKDPESLLRNGLPIGARSGPRRKKAGAQGARLLDKAFAAQATAADLVSKVGLVPAGLKCARARVQERAAPRRPRQWTMVKKDKDGTFAVDGILYKEAKMEMILGGYTTPLTSGNFLDLVSKGFYNGMAIQRADGFVVQTGDPTGPTGP
ncbi:peptidyl-prolyl cis-trans isomerase [Aureococcus anophagefferens]|nr:peptidyl-prolyl cis-trans isomerase [Aureococcus anophagefferens]